jgi:hypothetical protein
LSEDEVRSDIAVATGGVERCQRMIVLEHAIVERVRYEQVAGSVEADAVGIADAGGTWRGGCVRAGAYLGRETRAATALAENPIRGRVTCAGGGIERRQRLVEFEHAAVVLVGDEQVASRIGDQPARVA